MNASKLQSIGLGVVVYIVLSLGASFLMFNGGAAMSSVSGALACLIIIVAPVIAVWHYTSTNKVTLAGGPGAAMGAITAAVGAAIATLVSAGLQSAGVFPSNEEIFDRQRDQMIERGMSPEEVDGMMEMIGGMSSSLGTQLASSIGMGLVVGAIAGAIAAIVFKKGPESEEII